jgi:hypothetical protein
VVHIVTSGFQRFNLHYPNGESLSETRHAMHLRSEQSPLAYTPSLSEKKEEYYETSRMVTKLAEARRTPCLPLVTQCDVSSECFSFNKIHCRLAAPVSYRVSQKQVECVLCGGSPLPESESSSVNLFVSFFFFPVYLFLASPGSQGVWRWRCWETTRAASVGSGDSVECWRSMLFQQSRRLFTLQHQQQQGDTVLLSIQQKTRVA